MGLVCSNNVVNLICLPRLSHLRWTPPILAIHDDVIKWNHFPRYWPFVRGIHRSQVDSPVTRGFGVFFDLRLNKRLGKQSGLWSFETLIMASL